ncbi:hypothetical protein NA56DRAFT_707568 [Hyaloscypha hepaticicola]|uniref:Uncharacterized protein n=1 Tax=Hyaloscypha hepaticicola TaxID=2082293 RepID=A0A2J6PTU4_9HELO|nr:hypothetical protein NA56DRAFT_707568 [Hyaloscypha hepaticicola]
MCQNNCGDGFAFRNHVELHEKDSLRCYVLKGLPINTKITPVFKRNNDGDVLCRWGCGFSSDTDRARSDIRRHEEYIHHKLGQADIVLFRYQVGVIDNPMVLGITYNEWLHKNHPFKDQADGISDLAMLANVISLENAAKSSDRAYTSTTEMIYQGPIPEYVVAPYIE